MRHRNTFRIAFCGMLAALMLVVMLLGTMVPLATYVCPALAGALFIPILWEFNKKTAFVLYLAVSLLSLILAPDKEAALLFVFLLGWYPILRPSLQHITRMPLRIAAKLVLFNAAICVVYALLLFVLTSDLQADAHAQTFPLLLGMLLLGNVTFLVYDILLSRLTNLYVIRLRPKLFPRHLS